VLVPRLTRLEAMLEKNKLGCNTDGDECYNVIANFEWGMFSRNANGIVFKV
jgi:hypothetical protein